MVGGFFPSTVWQETAGPAVEAKPAEDKPDLVAQVHDLYSIQFVFQLRFNNDMFSSFSFCFKEKEKLLKEIAELEELRAKKAALLSPPAATTPRHVVPAPSPKHPSPESSQHTPSSITTPESDDEAEASRFLFVTLDPK